MDKKIYMVNDVVQLAGITRMGVIKAANEEKIRSFRTVGGVRLFLQEDVEAFLNRKNKRKQQTTEA